ncbi:MAG: polysaccharide deacetylase family protein [Spirochaetota bacterium]
MTDTSATPKRAVLTIDDAPSRDWAAKLEMLERLGVRAVFFCTGSALGRRPEFAAAALEAGHVLGNHGWNHPAFSELPLEECEREIDATHRLLERLHAEAGRAFAPRYFRFPYGDKGALTGSDTEAEPTPEGAVRRASVQTMLRDRGYTQPAFPRITYRWFRERGLLDDMDWYWTYDTMDWSLTADEPQYGIRTEDDLFRRIDEDVPEGGRGLAFPHSDEIVLIHDHVENSGLFGRVVRRIQEKGIEFRLPDA